VVGIAYAVASSAFWCIPFELTNQRSRYRRRTYTFLLNYSPRRMCIAERLSEGWHSVSCAHFVRPRPISREHVLEFLKGGRGENVHHRRQNSRSCSC
jgi:hypothetical protein